MTSAEHVPSRSETITVEIATIDQHGDPGHVHSRAEFLGRTAAATFAVSQAAMLAAGREVERIAATITAATVGATATELPFTGTPNELAVVLSGLPSYAAGVRRAEVPPPAVVSEVVSELAGSAPTYADSAPSGVDVVEVVVRSYRIDPLPTSRTPVGVYSKEDAVRIADAIATRVGGTVASTHDNQVLAVEHTVEVTDSESEAVQRQDRINHLRANIATLDKTTDAQLLGDLKKEMTGLQAQTPSFEAAIQEGGPRGVRTGTEVQGEDVSASRSSSQPASLRSMLNRQPAQPRERKAPSATVEASRPVTDRGLR